VIAYIVSAIIAAVLVAANPTDNLWQYGAACAIYSGGCMVTALALVVRDERVVV
jgi:hypothetical protein